MMKPKKSHPDYRKEKCPYCYAFLSYDYKNGDPVISKGFTETGYCPNHGKIIYKKRNKK